MSELTEQLKVKIGKEAEMAKIGKTSQSTNFHYRVMLDIQHAYELSIDKNGIAANDDVCAALLKLDNVLEETYKIFETKKNYFPFEQAADMAVEILCNKLTEK